MQPSEIGAGWRERVAQSAAPSWPWDQSDCPNYRSENYKAQLHRRGAIQRFYELEERSLTAHQVVEKYEPGWAVRSVDDVRQVLKQCATYILMGSRLSFSLVDASYLDGAGLLVRGRIEHVSSPATNAYFIAVRRGNIVSTLNLPDLGSEAEVRAIAARLVARLG
ncbi:hypothetical protein [Micromonospora sp. NPDC005324]|uniref:hypothetical protein n=1 Tax=Micromonospora sp. NPDC005324 TaxID=3157033 RepID=UPI0033A4F443